MKNIDVINNLISKKFNISLDIVEKINKFYWKEGVVKKISNLESGAIHIKGLLTFTTSRYNLYKEITKTISKIKNLHKSTKYTQKTKERIKNELYNRLNILLIERNNVANLIYNHDNRVR